MKNSDHQKPWPKEEGFNTTQITPNNNNNNNNTISNPNSSHFNQFPQIPNPSIAYPTLEPSDDQFIDYDDDWLIGGGEENSCYRGGIMTEESSRVLTDDDDERMMINNEGGSGDQAVSYSGSGYLNVDNDGGSMMVNNEGGSVNGVSPSGQDQDLTYVAVDDQEEEEEHYIHGITEKEYFETLPSGIRFEPHDHELILHYLKRKIDNQRMPHNQIKLVNLYKYSPYDVTARYPQLGENMWYFFTPRDRKYANGSRPNRAAGSGYWKATGKDKTIKMHGDHGPVIGFRKSLVFYDGNTRDGDKTSWTMHEYRVDEPSKRVRTCETDMRLDDYVLCKIIKKAERGSRNRKVGGAVKINKDFAVGTSSQYAEDNHRPIINGNNNPSFAASENNHNLASPQPISFHQPMMMNNIDYGTSIAFDEMPPPSPLSAVLRTCSYTKEEMLDFMGYSDPAEVLDSFCGAKQPFTLPFPDFPRSHQSNPIRYEREFSSPNMSRYGSEVAIDRMVTFPKLTSDPDDTSL